MASELMYVQEILYLVTCIILFDDTRGHSYALTFFITNSYSHLIILTKYLIGSMPTPLLAVFQQIHKD